MISPDTESPCPSCSPGEACDDCDAAQREWYDAQYPPIEDLPVEENER